MRQISGKIVLLGWLAGTVLSATATGAQTVSAAPASGTSAQQAAPLSPDAQFAAFVQSFRATAIAAGIKPGTYDRSMAGVMRDPDVEKANLQQPEFNRPIWSYLDVAVSPQRVANGVAGLQANETALLNIESRYGVPKEILVAIWGMESNYGQLMGGYSIFNALATLAYAGPRAGYARRELIDAMKMEEKESYQPVNMTSSWAGAFGHTQFIPSAFLQYAEDGDGDGKIDLWNSAPDALASTANLLLSEGWQRGQPWGYEVKLPANFPYEDAELDQTKPVSQWSKLGVTLPSGAALPSGDLAGAIIVPAGARGPAFLVFDNFRVVMKYNNSLSYALAVCYLADQIRGGPQIAAAWPRDEQMLTRDQRIRFQTDLKALGYDPGDIDGLLGRRVRAALRQYQKAKGLVADGFATVELLDRLDADVKAKGG